EFRKSSRRPTEALKCVKNIPTTKTVELKTPSTKSGLQYYTTSKMNLSRQSKVALNEQHDEHIAHSEVFKDSILGAVQFKEERALDEIIKHEDIVNSIFAQYEGEKIGWIMQFLEEELDRLHEERRVQAFAMLAEKERRKLEAAEAGLRQKENIRREEQEYFFQNIQNSNISTVNEYLENVILEEYELTASNDTTKYIENVAKMIAMESRMESSKKFDPKVLQESVSDLLIPAIYKRLERK
uniref:Uncharacterized protein n=1 Tax=Megaselia scalaris TaxID=36166 RepID=T1GKY5_MEGSC